MSGVLKMVTLLVTALIALVVPGVTPSATAAARPVVTAVQPADGPVAPSTVTIVGRNLRTANAVLFGTRAGTVVQRVSATAVKVRTPRGARVGSVSVRVRTGRTWSAVSRSARYTFVAPPKVTGLSRTTGTFAGGDELTLTGTALSTARSVTIGGAPATLVSATASRAVVRTPAGVPGSARLVVTTAGGATGSTTPAFTYVTPPAGQTSTLTPATGTQTASGVEWVTGGLDPESGETAPWVVGLVAGSPVPTVGQAYFMAPGDPVFPSGLTGTVSDVAVQADSSVRVTVAPGDLDDSLADVDLSYTGPVVDPDAQAPEAGAQQRSAPAGGRAATFPIGASALSCKDFDDNPVAFRADLALAVTGVQVDQDLRAGRFVPRPTYRGALTAEFTTTGKVTVATTATCSLRPAWQNAQRRVVPIGPSGLTVSFAPELNIKVTAEGTWSVLDRTQATFSVSATLGQTPTYSRSSRNVESRQSGTAGFKLQVAGGASIQFGLLDRAGLQATVEVGFNASLAASGGNVCVDGNVFARLTLGVFLDYFLDRWERDVFRIELGIATVRACVLPPAPAPGDAVAITSARLTDARVGSPYSDRLQTADDRGGSWSVVQGSLPAGLHLDPSSGVVEGTPAGPVGDSAFVVRFVDAGGAVATSTVRLRVQPSVAIGGGDLQFTLRWHGPADLDLHVTEPSGEEIYYSHSTSSSGGTLDRDANAGCDGEVDDENPVENIYWPQGTSPAGDYAVQVVNFDPCGGSLAWSLTVRRRGALVMSRTGSDTSELFQLMQGAGATARMAPRGARTAPERQWPAKP